jgi:hypothetical protein
MYVVMPDYFQVQLRTSQWQVTIHLLTVISTMNTVC